jgi:hypothetical protein
VRVRERVIDDYDEELTPAHTHTHTHTHTHSC